MFAIAHQPIPACIDEFAIYCGGDIRCSEYAASATPEVGSNAVKALEGRAAALIANHGLVAVGPRPDKVLHVTALVERTAQIVWGARALGGSGADTRRRESQLRRRLQLPARNPMYAMNRVQFGHARWRACWNCSSTEDQLFPPNAAVGLAGQQPTCWCPIFRSRRRPMAHRDPKLSSRSMADRVVDTVSATTAPAYAAPGSPEHRVPGRVRGGGHRPQRRGHRHQHPHPLRPRRMEHLRDNDSWVPTFPNARYLVPAADYHYFAPDGPAATQTPRTEEEAATSMATNWCSRTASYPSMRQDSSSDGRMTARSVRPAATASTRRPVRLRRRCRRGCSHPPHMPA